MRNLFLLSVGQGACQNNGMKRFLFALIFSPCVVSVAHAARLDISRLKQPGEFSASFGPEFITGDRAGGQTDFAAGRIKQLSLVLNYTPTENLTLTFDTDNNYSDSEIGFEYKLIKSDTIKLNVIANYGIAWTRASDTHDRFGENNFDGGMRVHGVLCDFQWSFQAMGQFVFDDPDNFWNINLTAQAMYYFHPDIATMLEFDYNILQIARPKTLYDRAISLGIIYNFNETSSINPYIKFHFKTRDYQYQINNGNDYWKIGVQLSIEF